MFELDGAANFPGAIKIWLSWRPTCMEIAMPWWVGSLTFAYCLYLVATCSGLVLLRRLAGQHNRVWRPINVTTVVLGMLGLVSATTEANRQSNLIQATLERPRAVTSALPLQGFSQWAPGYFCHPSERSALSPPNFDAIAAEKSMLCEWATRLKPLVGDIKFDDLPELPSDRQLKFPDVKFPPYRDDKKRFEQHLAYYAGKRLEYLALERGSQTSDLQRVSAMIAPVVIAIALALATVKAWYENRS